MREAPRSPALVVRRVDPADTDYPDFVEHLHLSLNLFAFNLLVIHIITFLLVNRLNTGLNSLGLPHQHIINELTMSGLMFGVGGIWLII